MFLRRLSKGNAGFSGGVRVFSEKIHKKRAETAPILAVKPGYLVPAPRSGGVTGTPVSIIKATAPSGQLPIDNTHDHSHPKSDQKKFGHLG